MDGLQTGPDPSGPPMRTMGTPNIVPADVFPPVRAQAPDNSIFLPYITEDITFEEEYEEYLSDLGWSNEETNAASAWHRLQPDFNPGDISDSESIDPIGDLGEDGRLDVPRDETNENLNNWEVSPYFSIILHFTRHDNTSAHEPKDNGCIASISCRA